MNHKFTTIAWGLVFIIILFCGCSNMVETLRSLSDVELSVVLLCDDNTNATNIEIPLGEAQSFSFIVKDKNTGEIIDNVYFLKDIQWGYPKKPLENSDTIEVSFPEDKQTMRVKGVKATEAPNEIYVTVNGVKSNVCTVTVQDKPREPEKEIKVILTSNDQQVDNLELQVDKERKFSFKIQDAQTGEIVSDLTIIKDIQWSYSESDYISYTLDSNRIILTVKGVKATETPNEIYVTVNGVKSNVCTVTVKDPWEDIEVVIAYDKIPVEEFKLPLHRQRHLSALLRDKDTKEFITNPPPIKDGIQWTYPQNDNDIEYETGKIGSYGDVLTLIGEREVTEPQEIFVTINGIRSESCMVTVGNFYAAETQEELEDVIKRTESSAVTKIHIEGPSLVSKPNSINEIAQKLQKKDANGRPIENGKKYTLDLTAATDVDLSIPNADDIRYNYSIEHVLLPEDLTTIGEHAFWGFAALAKITIPPKVTTIGKYAFGSCFGIEEIVIPASVESIGENAFSLCTGLKKIRFEPRDKDLNIASGAFALCTSLSEVIIDKETAGLITGAGADNLKKYIKDPTTP
ncbi:MAG: leucine-rich repeat domain-containing protein [Candidatus Treponema excrementipullorum]|nr:leucine-rich repeat domain-containing protein [Candidatus Treponema excrementipullorum]